MIIRTMALGLCFKSSTAVAVVSGAALLIAGVVLGFKVFPDIVQDQVAEQILLKPGTQSWQLWEKLPIPMNFKIYIFNVTNADAIHEGHTPKVVEIGPYVYKEYREKRNIVIHEKYGTASYYQKMWFVFDPVASEPYREDDIVNIFNVAMMGIIEVGISQGIPTWMLGAALPTLFNKTTNFFLEVAVKDLLFGGVKLNCQGIGKMVCDQMKELTLPPTIKILGEDLYFSLFGFKNESSDGRYEVKLGWGPLGPYPSVDAAKTVGIITSWENSSKLNKWQGDECNKISGTDAAIFSPFLTEKSRIDIFSTDLCRSLYAVYSGEGNYQGIPSLRFAAEEYMLANVSENPNNNCFCPEEKACLLKGALDLTPCQGVPVILTLPHFYMSSEEYLNKIIGLKPERGLHETYLEIEPTTGIPLSGGKRIQFNMMMRAIDGISITAGVPKALFPFVWIDEGLNLDEKNVNMLKDQLINTLNILEIVKWVLIGVGAGVLGIGIILLITGFSINKGIKLSTA